ncbi:MAG: 2-oxo acid dehydrogenase subunit E2 [Deltaproteobacteria bacterium]|nr:2-oxo acid dehydrogenase subunit E2 [Deltaproteobacteria bacterium]MBW2051701.1 2-oxo acid dehydrogenase subunit E2 [Deltaproteobacteria bacterium]MBW2139970.1 2-oxo acid dehydrogenase subunit E2 [Deltaproteobacteria bacterium]MBW2322321.1 2-oxo acid dehydrogenase subunit E2 [Deltaproteobacteria bacterium]
MKKAEYTAKPFPKNRRLVVDAGFMAHRKHVIYALMEVDVTKPRQFFREHKVNSGESLSFTAFIITCLGRAVEMDRNMHAYRNWRGRLILFHEVDVHTPIETESGRATLPHIIRGANNKTFYDIHSEIRAIQADPESDPISRKIEWFVRLPGFIRRGLYWIFTRNPQLWKRYGGTVTVSAIGMIGQVPGWGIPFGNHTLGLTLGGIVEKPGVVNGRIEIREYLNITLSMNHDIIDGAPAARFFEKLKDLIENGYGLGE